MKNKNLYINFWLNSCCVLIFIMILVGGATRLTQSGLSMVDWKPVMGIIPPLDESQWNESFEKYKNFPEYQKINQYKKMDLSGYKKIFYWEYAHRILGRIIGLFFIIPFFIFLKKKYLPLKLRKPLLIAIFLVVFQGVLGWFMVKSGLVNNPHVSHYRLASHLLLAFFLFGYTYWIKLSLNSNLRHTLNNRRISNHINFLILLYFLQVLFGAFIAGTKAGLLWNTFPLMEGKLIPEGLMVLQPFYLNFFENMKMFQFAHRLLAILILVYSGWFFINSQEEYYNKYSGMLFMAFIIQLYLGIMTLLFKVPVVLGVIHQGMAALIILILVQLKFLIVNAKVIDR